MTRKCKIVRARLKTFFKKYKISRHEQQDIVQDYILNLLTRACESADPIAILINTIRKAIRRKMRFRKLIKNSYKIAKPEFYIQRFSIEMRLAIMGLPKFEKLICIQLAGGVRKSKLPEIFSCSRWKIQVSLRHIRKKLQAAGFGDQK